MNELGQRALRSRGDASGVWIREPVYAINTTDHPHSSNPYRFCLMIVDGEMKVKKKIEDKSNRHREHKSKRHG